MAKLNKPNPRPNNPPARAAAPSSRDTVFAAPPSKNWLERPSTASDADPFLKKVFYGVAAIGLVVMLYMAMGSGINADDKFQNDYCTKLVNYYSTFGKDTSAIFVKDGNMHLYGGFFEVVTGFANKAFGFTEKDLAYHNVRHLSSATLGWVAMLCAGLLGYLIAGWQAGILTLIVMFCSPRFMGDSLMNPKDIPFAAGYIMALYNLGVVLRDMPNPRRWNLVGLVAGLAMALATRAGGLLPFAYIFMFGGLHFLFTGRQNFMKYVLVLGGTVLAGYVLAILFWPYAMQSPLKNPLNALSQFSALEVKIRVLFEGKNMMSDKTPWYYAVKWMGLTIPLLGLIGFFGYLVTLPRTLKRYNPLLLFMVLFVAVFPVFYVIYKHSVLHDGWRHLTFSFPPLALAAGLFWNELVGFFANKTGKYSALGVFAVLALLPLGFIAANAKYPYTYFNELAGGTKGALGQYETDYWGLSVRQGIEWMESQGILKPDMTETVVIATNMYYSAKQLCAKYGDKVKIKYIKWDRRCDDAWDYALYPTRFIDGSTLQKGFWPPENAVHIVEAGGAPLLAVLKDNGKNCSLGMTMSKVGNWLTAISYLKKEVTNVPDNDLAWSSLASAYLNINNLDSAKICADKALEIAPNDGQTNNTVGLIMMQRKDMAGAKKQFEHALKLEPSNAGAWYYLALIAQAQGDNNTAIAHVLKCVNMAPNFKPAFQLGVAISEAMGNTAQAQQFQGYLNQMK